MSEKKMVFTGRTIFPSQGFAKMGANQELLTRRYQPNEMSEKKMLATHDLLHVVVNENICQLKDTEENASNTGTRRVKELLHTLLN